MRLAQHPREEKAKSLKAREPIAEGIIPLRANKTRDWKSMDDKEVLEIAGRFMKEKGIRSGEEMRKADSGLYSILVRRKLLDKVRFEERFRKWGTDREVLEIARSFIGERGIKRPKGLERADSGLYTILKRRKLIDEVKFEENIRKWGTDEEVLDFARRFIEEKGIGNRSDLIKIDNGLYQILRKRKLFTQLKFETRRKVREWGTDSEVLGIARKFIDEKGIKNKEGLAKADSGLYTILKRRKLIDEVKFEEKQVQRKWGTDGEVLDFARRLIEEKGIRKRKGLEEADGGLYQVLQKRRLLDKVRFEERQQHRAWGTDEEVLGIARKLIEGKGVKNRKGLERADLGLYRILQKRKLLDQVFASIDHAKHKAAVQGVLDAMDSFGDDK